MHYLTTHITKDYLKSSDIVSVTEINWKVERIQPRSVNGVNPRSLPLSITNLISVTGLGYELRVATSDTLVDINSASTSTTHTAVNH